MRGSRGRGSAAARGRWRRSRCQRRGSSDGPRQTAQLGTHLVTGWGLQRAQLRGGLSGAAPHLRGLRGATTPVHSAVGLSGRVGRTARTLGHSVPPSCGDEPRVAARRLSPGSSHFWVGVTGPVAGAGATDDRAVLCAERLSVEVRLDAGPASPQVPADLDEPRATTAAGPLVDGAERHAQVLGDLLSGGEPPTVGHGAFGHRSSPLGDSISLTKGARSPCGVMIPHHWQVMQPLAKVKSCHPVKKQLAPWPPSPGGSRNSEVGEDGLPPSLVNHSANTVSDGTASPWPAWRTGNARTSQCRSCSRCRSHSMSRRQTWSFRLMTGLTSSHRTALRALTPYAHGFAVKSHYPAPTSGLIEQRGHSPTCGQSTRQRWRSRRVSLPA